MVSPQNGDTRGGPGPNSLQIHSQSSHILNANEGRGLYFRL